MASEQIHLSDLLQCLIKCSEKAARIAQILRNEDDLFQLLVEEKSDTEKNKRFVRNFRTLVVVLLRETILRDVAKQFPSLGSYICAEEHNSFQNSLGESIRVKLTDLEDETTALLSQVLDGRDHVAKLLASVVHSNNSNYEKQCSSTSIIPASGVGIWIDPIDSTSEYIQARSEETNDLGMQQSGLKCVCVLIGVFDLRSGKPILGVVNQPFFNQEGDPPSWRSKYYWSLNYEGECITSASLQNNLRQEYDDRKVVVVSSSEKKQLQETISSKYRTVHAAGSGYKSLLVACKMADLYVLSRDTTYFCETCAPHALLSAQGGGILKFNEIHNATSIDSNDLVDKQVTYLLKDDKDGSVSFRNVDGLIAYRKPEDVIELFELLKGQKLQN
ncbi:inositol polyphosphate 1-phosphatase [Caerostris extrusa]|uniref:Inositol polyphosphate 1-phosphatase n=1 Tax=Caerostris extrusa TaxID=172846 RepID=A0AAV4U4G4_CAEEX|nr:inositol polyphosphate 1-phosphatase [Caerostris extrusa]